jgi:hypothetical protein
MRNKKGKNKMKSNFRKYKGHEIYKVSRRYTYYKIVGHDELFCTLKEAKETIDKMEE